MLLTHYNLWLALFLLCFLLTNVGYLSEFLFGSDLCPFFQATDIPEDPETGLPSAQLFQPEKGEDVPIRVGERSE